MTHASKDGDAEVRRFIDGAPRLWTYTDLARECLARFGARRAWDRERIMRYWRRRSTAGAGARFKLWRDLEVREFVEDRLFRFTLDELTAACRETFAPARAPSRSAIHRYASWLRATDRD